MGIAELLGYLAAALSAALGVWGILHDFKTKDGRITGAGKTAIFGLAAAAALSVGVKYTSDQANLRRAEDAREREVNLRQDLQRSAARQAQMAKSLASLSEDLESSRARESALLEDLEDARRDVARAASGSFFLSAEIKVALGRSTQTILGKGAPSVTSGEPVTCKDWSTKACRQQRYNGSSDCRSDPDKFHSCDFIDRGLEWPPHPALRLNRNAPEWSRLFSGHPQFPAFGVYVIEPNEYYARERAVEIFACDLVLDVLTLDTASPDFDTGAPENFVARSARDAFGCNAERYVVRKASDPSRRHWRADRWLIKDATSEVVRHSERDLMEGRADQEDAFAILTEEGVQSFHASLPLSSFGAIDQLAGKIVVFHTLYDGFSHGRDPGVPFQSRVSETPSDRWSDTPRMLVQVRDGDGAFSPEYGMLSSGLRAEMFRKAGYRVVRLASEHEAATLIQFPESRERIRRCLRPNRC